MAWKVKEKYRDYKPGTMNLSYGELLPHQIEKLSEVDKKKYFTNDTPKPKKKKKVEKVEVDTNPYNEYTD
jgi:hypothetical protein